MEEKHLGVVPAQFGIRWVKTNVNKFAFEVLLL